MTCPFAPSVRPRVVTLLFAVAALALRGQVTETPQTVAPGKVLIEMDGLKLSYDRADAAGNKHTVMGVASTIVTAGLTSSVDLQVGFELFLRRKFESAGWSDSRSGFGDLSFRTKWTFWRDEASASALAVMPYVKVPTNTDDVGSEAIEGGIMFPWAMGVGRDLTAGAMFRWDMVRNPDDNGYDALWTTTGFVQRKLTGSFGVYAEAMISASSTGLSHWASSVGVGALWNLTKFLQFDYELQRGLGRRSTDWTHVFRVNWEW